MNRQTKVEKASVGNSTSQIDDDTGDLSRIGEMATEFGVTLRTLRFYEDRGLVAPVREGNTRLYTHRDRARLRLILLGRKVGFSLREVKQMLDLYDPQGTNIRQMRVALEKSEKQLSRLVQQRAALDDAIDELSRMTESLRTELATRAQNSVSN